MYNFRNLHKTVVGKGVGGCDEMKGLISQSIKRKVKDKQLHSLCRIDSSSTLRIIKGRLPRHIFVGTSALFTYIDAVEMRFSHDRRQLEWGCLRKLMTKLWRNQCGNVKTVEPDLESKIENIYQINTNQVAVIILISDHNLGSTRTGGYFGLAGM